MNLKQVGSNMTELTLNNGDVILFSYQTPVAAKTEQGYLRTTTHYSITTTKHLNKWLEYTTPKMVDQSVLDSLVA